MQESTIKSREPGAEEPDAAPDNVSDRTIGSLLLLALTVLAGAAMRSVFGSAQELAKHALDLTDLQMSFVQGLAASIPVAILAIPIGRLVDRTNRVRILLLLALVSVVGTFLTAFAQGFASLFIARMLSVLGALCGIPVAISIAADLSSLERRGRAVLLLSVGQAIGIALGFALSGALIGAATQAGGWFGLEPWRSTHLLFGIGAIVTLAWPALALREPARREVGNLVHPPLGRVLAELWGRRAYLAPLFVGQIGVVMADVAAGIWAAPVLARDHGLQPEQFGGAIGLAVLVPGLVGSVIGGFAADAGEKSGRRGGMLYGAVVAAALAIPASLFPLADSLVGFTTVFGLFLLCGAITGLITATVLATRIPNELRGVCLSAFIVVSSIVGMGIAPTVVTLVSDALGGEAHLAQSLAGTGLLISIVSVFAFTLAAWRLPPAKGAIDGRL